MALAFLLLAVAAGGALPVQAGVNARLAAYAAGPVRVLLGAGVAFVRFF